MSRKFLVFCLVCLFFFMSAFDAPEYVRCTHIGICEFMDLGGHLLRRLSSDIPYHHAGVAPNSFIDILENIANNNESRKNFAFLSPPSVLRTCAVLLHPHGHNKFDVSNTRQETIQFNEVPPSQHIQLVEVSIILC